VERVGGTYAVILMIVMISSVLHSGSQSILENEPDRMEQFGGGGSIEDQCGAITFEDMFIYDKAIFDVRIQDDWKSAEVRAKAWINWTHADDIREDLDAYLEDIIPSGGDGWLSTDEVGSVILIAADCLQYSITRIGIRDGSPHRGGTGVDWQNTTWQDEGMEIEQYNGVPPRHSEKRDCNSSFDGECYEVPVIPSSERDCDTEINQSLGLDECRVVLWLNATLEIDGVDDPNDFTVSFNSSNMSNAKLNFTFPTIPDLRLDEWEECEGRFVGSDEENPMTDSAPIRGSCIGDSSTYHELSNNGDGSLTYSLFPNSNRENWPLGEDIFADFTTSPIPVDNPPEWTQSAPPNGTWFPVSEEGQSKWLTWQDLSAWFDDESGVSSLDIECDSDASAISQSIDRSLWVNVEGTVEVSCGATDAMDQSSGNRTWIIGVPLTISTSTQILTNPHPILVSLNAGWPSMTVQVAISQGDSPTGFESFEINSEMSLSISSAGVAPGPVFVWIHASVSENPNGGYMEKIFDLGITKESLPPQIYFSTTSWEGSSLKISGQFSDPDGEEVTLNIAISGVSPENLGELDIGGNTWEIEWLNPELSATLGDHELSVTGCDESGKCTTEKFVVSNEGMPVTPGGGNDESDEINEPLPASGLVSVSMSFLVAIMYGRRRE